MKHLSPLYSPVQTKTVHNVPVSLTFVLYVNIPNQSTCPAGFHLFIE